MIFSFHSLDKLIGEKFNAVEATDAFGATLLSPFICPLVRGEGKRSQKKEKIINLVLFKNQIVENKKRLTVTRAKRFLFNASFAQLYIALMVFTSLALGKA